MQTVYQITFAHHIQLEVYRHVLVYYPISKICPAICIHIHQLAFPTKYALWMVHCLQHVLPNKILISSYLLLPLMTKLGIGIPDYDVIIYKGLLIYISYYNGPTCLCLNSTMSPYDYVYLLIKAMSPMTLLSRYSHIHFQFILS